MRPNTSYIVTHLFLTMIPSGRIPFLETEARCPVTSELGLGHHRARSFQCEALPGSSGLRGCSPGRLPGRPPQGPRRRLARSWSSWVCRDAHGRGEGKAIQKDQRYWFLSAFPETAQNGRHGNSPPCCVCPCWRCLARPRDVTTAAGGHAGPAGAAHVPSGGSVLIWTCLRGPAPAPR